MALTADPWDHAPAGRPPLAAAPVVHAGPAAEVAALLDWGVESLDLLSSACLPASPAELRRLAGIAGRPDLPEAYAAFLSIAGSSRPGSLLPLVFPGADVAIESMLPGDDWPGARGYAGTVIEELVGERTPLLAGDLVVYVHRSGVVQWLRGDGPDPAVHGLRRGDPAPRAVAPSFTAWLEHRLRRAIKRRFPLRDARFPRS